MRGGKGERGRDDTPADLAARTEYLASQRRHAGEPAGPRRSQALPASSGTSASTRRTLAATAHAAGGGIAVMHRNALPVGGPGNGGAPVPAPPVQHQGTGTAGQ